MKRISKELRATAYHEAGHAVASYLLRIGLKGASIIPDEDSEGRVRNYPQPALARADYGRSAPMRDRIERLVKVLLAGEITERFISGKKRITIHQDHENAVSYLELLVSGDDELSAYLDLLSIQTKKMFAPPGIWLCVEVVADALIEHRTLSGRRLRAIIKEALLNSFTYPPVRL